MYAGGVKLVGLLGVSITALFLSGAAAAESANAPGAQKEERAALRMAVAMLGLGHGEAAIAPVP